MRISWFLGVLVVGIPLFISCGQDKSAIPTDSTKHDSMPAAMVSQNIEVKTFEVIDSVGKSHGWGYDLYVNGKKTIHQPIIPAVPGNNSFANETDAKKVGELAAQKMKATGSFPTILVHDLDSLGIQHLK